LVLGLYSLPNKAQANFFANLFGGNASASVVPVEVVEEKNLQNMSLLQASAISVFQTNKKEQIDQNVDLNIVSDTALSPVVLSTGVSTEQPSMEDISVYVVKSGDSLGAIAKMFNVSSETILWANDMKKGDSIKEGMVLVILPISGAKHTVVKGETLSSIAKKYNADIYEIIGFNDFEENYKPKIGEEIVIPNAEITEEKPKTASKNTSSNTKSNPSSTNPSGAYFINPVPSARLTQGLHGALRRGVDLGAPTGTPILASASGTVEIARLGYNGGYGNMVIVKHTNGTKTLYAHMVRLGTSTGAKVEQGQIIGYVGSTGRSTGPHLHFEVHGALNPGATGSWKKRSN
jgi:LysM repeat protein